MQLRGMKRELAKMRGEMGEFADESKKQEYQNEVNKRETQIRDFDANWSRLERSRIEAAKKAAAEQLAEIEKIEGSGSLDTSGIMNTASGIFLPQTSTGIRVPNIEIKIQTGATITPPILLPPKTNTGVIVPKPIAPIKSVSSPAIPVGTRSITTPPKFIVSPSALPTNSLSR